MAEHQDAIPGLDEAEERVVDEREAEELESEELATPLEEQDEDLSTPIEEREEDPSTPIEEQDEDPSTPIEEQDEDLSSSLEDREAVRGHLHLDYVGRSHVGLIRKNNQDSGYASPTMLLVADGMGGAAAGDLASTVAVTAAEEHDELVIGAAMLDALSDTVRRANNKIADLVADDHTLEGMGTTVSGGLFDGSRFGVCHIGDSRIYLIRDGELERLTHDHSWVQSLVDDGKITEEEAAFHPHRSLLIKVLNGHPTNVPDTQLVELRSGDRLVLCSDGLCGLVDDEEIHGIAREGAIATVADDLVEAALQAGGLDNVTVIVADVVEAEPQPPLDPVVLGAAVDTPIPDISAPTVDLGDDEASEEDVDDDAPLRPSAPTPAEPDDEDRRYAMTTPPRRRWIARLVAVVLAVMVLVGLGTGLYAWGQTQYYVGAADNQVAIYQGLPQNVLGIPLSTVYQFEDIPLDDLPTYLRDQVNKSIPANSLDGAKNTVAELRREAERCRALRQTPPAPPATPSTPSTPSSSPPTGPSTNPDVCG